MSAVYLGRKVDTDNASDVPTVVALKIVRHDVRNEQMLQMFLEEGRLIARLRHPNIVRTHEVSGDAEQDFIAMELMLGKTFAAIHDAIAARDVRLNPEIAAWTAARVADALHYAHELMDETNRPLGLVHRDVNPANIFATFNGEIKLFDFGLAKVTAGEVSGSHLLAGKLSYLSPEQIMQMPLDRRSDVFSLGTTLWELLTGRRLFRRDSDLDTVRAVQLGPIPDPRTIAPEIPEELARIARTALERNREHRYPNALYLARELDAFIFSRTSPNDVTARLAQLVDTLFPGEQKKQHGWLKPAVGKSLVASTTPGPVSMMQGASGRGSQWASAGRPSPPPRSLSPRETTAVMPNAPRRPESSPSLDATPASDRGAPPISSSAAFAPPSSAPRVPIATPSSAAKLGPDPLAPSSSQRLPLAPDTLPTSMPDPPSIALSETVASFTPPSSSAPAVRVWPMPKGGPASVPPPPPQRHRPPASRAPSIPAPPIQGGSRTDIQARADLFAPPSARTVVEPVVELDAITEETRADAAPAPNKPVDKAPGGLPTNFTRPKRAPIPLPSRLKDGKKTSIPPPAARPSQAPPAKKSTPPTDPPNSDTQVDMQIPPPPGVPGRPRR